LREIDVKALAARLERGEPCYLLDVRQPWENQLAALPGSKLIPLHQLTARYQEIAEGVPIIVYCHHGIRSRSAALALEQLGFTNVYSLAGGIDAWSLEVDPQVPRY
jgi:rhodanese-related sulfurtransferase